MASDFQSLGISEELKNILVKHGYKEPTPIQQQVIPVLLSGKDAIAQSQTGTGKTLAFALPILQRIDNKKPYVQALIITPTRELALQITNEIEKLSKPLGIKALSLYGGKELETQSKKLKGGAVHIIIGTPGRILDHLKRRTLNFGGLSMLVLDEADQMIKLGFLEDIEIIMSAAPSQRQTMLFSATMPKGIRSLVARYMRKPVEIRVQGKHVTLDEIKQIAIEVPEKQKIYALCKLIDQLNPFLAIIFCISKERVKALNLELGQKGYAVDALHGDLSQNKREQILKRFRNAELQLLVATDIAARGLDIEGVTHIFNYDVPKNAETYIHRIGRTGRAGQEGMAITLVDEAEIERLRSIESGINKRIDRWTDENQDNPGEGKLDFFVPKKSFEITSAIKSVKSRKSPGVKPSGRNKRVQKSNKKH
ncbi:DEAD/DEAH box helicase [Fonticella tunisiensis]|uniref:ATP-dependent RNA helicase DeaD n=1 Tax=Fonticella tunisiensis TaxID=1096341 RepID=A0A4V3ES21_9CLOT|nr:DEAD/DEAH box helicase [Fonticella tunisiensis]TDT51362.1 ATP-dependent RNA helicase DeaD [Fonticella tunisiensis]